MKLHDVPVSPPPSHSLYGLERMEKRLISLESQLFLPGVIRMIL